MINLFALKSLGNLKNRVGILAIIIGFTMAGCNQSNFLDKKPTNIVGTNTFFSDPSLIKSNVANLYGRMFRIWGLNQYWNFTNYAWAFPSNSVDYWRQKQTNYPYAWWSYWDYGYIHDINLFIDRIKKADQLDQAVQQRFFGEGQFLRANFYFDEVRSMGGVPILLDTLKYNFSGSGAYLDRPRAPEAKVYDLVISEADSAAQKLPKDPGIKDRATWAAAMTLKSTAALFAGSIAQYNVTTPSVSLPNNVVGIPANKADHYYKIALSAAQKIIKSGEYHLYMKFPNNLQKNFAELFLDKNNNPEVIFQKDYKIKSITTQYTVQNQPRSNTEEAATSGMVNPSLNFAQGFEKLNNTFAPFKIKNPDGTYIRYDHKMDIFKGRDARLGGTVILPGSQFRGQDLDIWAGYYLPQKPKGQRIITGSQLGQLKALPGQSTPTQVVGRDGPIDNKQHATQTGFYIRKYLDPTPAAGEIGTGSAVPWIYYRYAQVLLNAAEASFQLGNKTLAAKYLDQIRKRAGFKTPLKPHQITFKRIVHARLTELAFEGKRVWDLRRWRLAGKIWNGGKTDLKDPGNPWAPSTKPWGLWPYKVYDPGKPDNGKWIFKHVLPSEVTAAHHFRLGNYYSAIPGNVLGSNPEIVQNPNQ